MGCRNSTYHKKKQGQQGDQKSSHAQSKNNDDKKFNQAKSYN